MAEIEIQTADRLADPREAPVGIDMVRRARAAGLTVSAYLNEVQPGDPDDELDAYERQLARFNIRTEDDHRSGLPASTVGEFWKPKTNDGKRDLPREQWATERFESNQPQSWALFPEFINRILRVQPLADDVLADLIAVMTGVDEPVYQSIYLKDTVQGRRLSRVAEGEELPRLFGKIVSQSVTLPKYGGALEMTYEILRRIRIPLFTVITERVRAQVRQDQAADAVDVLVNGDGNNNAATNYNVTTLDSAAPAGPGTVTDPYLAQQGDPAATSTIAKKLTYQAWLQWRASMYPLGMTAVVGRMNEILQVLTLQMPTINPTLLLGLLEGGNGQVKMGRVELPDSEIWSDVKLIYLPYAPGGMLVGLNKSQALEMLMENDSEIAENDADILHQRRYLTMSQNVGFSKIITSASTTLSLQ